MAILDYLASKEIESRQYPLEGIIMAAMRKADTAYLGPLKTAFPSIWKELQDRYNAPGGILPGEE